MNLYAFLLLRINKKMKITEPSWVFTSKRMWSKSEAGQVTQSWYTKSKHTRLLHLLVKKVRQNCYYEAIYAINCHFFKLITRTLINQIKISHWSKNVKKMVYHLHFNDLSYKYNITEWRLFITQEYNEEMFILSISWKIFCNICTPFNS